MLTALVFPEHLALPRQEKKKKCRGGGGKPDMDYERESGRKETVGTPAEGLGGKEGESES